MPVLAPVGHGKLGGARARRRALRLQIKGRGFQAVARGSVCLALELILEFKVTLSLFWPEKALFPSLDLSQSLFVRGLFLNVRTCFKD